MVREGRGGGGGEEGEGRGGEGREEGEGRGGEGREEGEGRGGEENYSHDAMHMPQCNNTRVGDVRF